MIDRYKIIIWAKAEEDTLEKQVNQAYSILKKLEAHKLITTLYLPAKRKDQTKKFELTYEHVEKLILEKQDKKFPNLGSELSFFSSMNENESLSINFSVGRSNSNFNNSMIINIPLNFSFEQICNYIYLFKELVQEYNAYYACITSNFNLNSYNDWFNYDKNIPNIVFWINYWGENISNVLKVSKQIEKGRTHKFYEIEQYGNGYFLRLQEQPIDMNNKKQIYFQQEMSKIFKL